MIGQSVTLVRVKPQQRSGREVFTTKGVITDVTEDAEGSVTGIRIRGVRVETGDARDSWFAVGPDALNGSLCTEQSATLDACGHPVTDMCACDGALTSEPEHTCGPGINYGCEHPECDGEVGD